MSIEFSDSENFRDDTLREKCPYSEFFWSVFSRIWTDYGEILRISRSQSECEKIRTRKNPNADNFHPVVIIRKSEDNDSLQSENLTFTKYAVLLPAVTFDISKLNHYVS